MPLPTTQILLSLLALSGLMALAWVYLSKKHRLGHVDLLWAVVIGIQAAAYAWTSEGWVPRRIALTLLAGLWAMRLAAHLSQRLGRDGEDGRYLAMAAAAGPRAPLFFFGFFQLQAVAAWVFAIPFAALVQDPEPAWRVWEVLGLGLWCASLVGNGIADRQLDRWRSDPANRGKTCRSGLWAWSRHPNYFFEWLLWCAYPLAAIGTPFLLLNLGIAALMLVMVTKVSGIPFTEQQALRSRGDDYRDYQASTSPFFLRPPSHVPDHPSS
ncbi:MAG: DUF1295 domain-containing protein [Planctomycetota bacterium]